MARGPSPKDIGLGLRLIRQAQKLSQEQLAKGAGVSASNLSGYETGRTDFMVSTLCRLLRAMNVGLIDLDASIRRGRGEKLLSVEDWHRAFEILRDEDVLREELDELRGGGDDACSELALERIRITLRGVRILVLIRDPIERARSHYWSRALQGRETRSFEEVVEDELRVPLEEMRPRTHYLVFPGMYDRHLSRLRSRFSPERVKMLCFEEVVHAPASALAEVQDFLGVPVCLKELLHRNKPVAALLPGARRAIRRSAESGAPWTRVVRAALPDQLRRRLTRRLFALERRINRRGFVAPPIPEAVRARLEEAFEQTGVVRC